MNILVWPVLLLVLPVIPIRLFARAVLILIIWSSIRISVSLNALQVNL